MEGRNDRATCGISVWVSAPKFPRERCVNPKVLSILSLWYLLFVFCFLCIIALIIYFLQFRWKGQWYWGLSYMESNICSLQFSAAIGQPDNKLDGLQQTARPEKNPCSAVTSSAEAKNVLKALSIVCGENLHFAAGAGYKCLCVIQDLVDFYVFSEDTTFKWDSCAPHAILKSLGGGMLDLSECIKSAHQNKKLCVGPHLLYNSEVQGAKGADRWANKGGLVAYRSEQQLEFFINMFTNNLSLPN